MGLFLCQFCDKQWKPDHECKDEDIEQYIQDLKNRANQAEYEIHKIKEGVLKVVSQVPDLNVETVTLKTDFLKELWESASCQYNEQKTIQSFRQMWMAVHEILRRSFDLFRKTSYYKEPDDFLSKLKKLYETCGKAKETLGYQSSVFQHKPEDLV